MTSRKQPGIPPEDDNRAAWQVPPAGWCVNRQRMTTYSHQTKLSILNIVVCWEFRGNTVDKLKLLTVADWDPSSKSYPQMKGVFGRRKTTVKEFIFTFL